MRLLNTSDFTFKDFNESRLEPYTILSHCWGQGLGYEEITYQQLIARDYERETYGWRKVSECCRISRSRGFQWIWIDTCCIDKTSSAELTETINSMWRWYQYSAECYVFLDDARARQRIQGDGTFSNDVDPALFRNCRWFTRGWTLQELLAPGHVLFFDQVGSYIGSRTELSVLITSATGIDAEYLTGHTPVWAACVAQRMSWAAERSTTREEDMAYALLGLFEVNLPLLYGEGKQAAFQRLQHTIIQHSDDTSIFAWGLSDLDREAGKPTAVLARGPADFASSGSVRSAAVVLTYARTSYQITNRGIAYSFRDPRVSLRYSSDRARETIGLACSVKDNSRRDTFLFLHLTLSVGRGRYYRVGITTKRSNIWSETLRGPLGPLMHEKQIYLASHQPRQDLVESFSISHSDFAEPMMRFWHLRISTNSARLVLFILLLVFNWLLLLGWSRLYPADSTPNALFVIGMFLLAKDTLRISPWMAVTCEFLIIGMSMRAIMNT